LKERISEMGSSNIQVEVDIVAVEKKVRTLAGITKYLVFSFPMPAPAQPVDGQDDVLLVDCQKMWGGPVVQRQFTLRK